MKWMIYYNRSSIDKPAETLSYQFVFQEYVGLDPLSATRQELVEAARKHNFYGR